MLPYSSHLYKACTSADLYPSQVVSWIWAYFYVWICTSPDLEFNVNLKFIEETSLSHPSTSSFTACLNLWFQRSLFPTTGVWNIVSYKLQCKWNTCMYTCGDSA